MESDTYKTIKEVAKGYILEKRSKFYSFAFPVIDETEVKSILDGLKKEYYDARHHCFAYILGPNKDIYRVNDDGEPSGSAGRPIYGQLLSNDLTNILVVVIRYFGGIKLGVPGLISAYKSAAIDALSNADVMTKIVKAVYAVDFNYFSMNNVMKIIKDENLDMLSSNFDLDCHIEFAVRKSEEKKVFELFEKINGSNIKYCKTI